LRFVGEDVGELALAFVAPLGAENDGDGHVLGRVGTEKREREGGYLGAGRWIFNCPMESQ
jgi:hypothetical protein